jgi:YD repeat-containing protein
MKLTANPLKLLLTSLCLGMLTYGYSQNDGSIPQVAPTTPNQASLFKTVEQPAGVFSGAPPVSIPLLTAGKGQVQAPISLNYNTGGIKVEEMAGSVGLGWNLNVGGSITRVMNGLPDDYQGGYLQSSYKPSTFQSQIGLDTTYVVFLSVTQGYLDLQPDIFYYNFNGLSGRFFFNESGAVILEEPNGIMIAPVYQDVYDQNLIMGWILTDTKGNKYYFGLNKSQSVTAVDPNALSYTSENGYTNLNSRPAYNATWHLLEVDDMNAENIITFSYQASLSEFETRSAAYEKIQAAGTAGCTSSDFYTDETYVDVTAQEKFIQKIITPVDSVVFYNSVRIDGPGGLRVDSIKQFDNYGNLKKNYHLNYNFFIGNNPLNLTGYDYNQRILRLQLASLAEIALDRSDSITQSFQYYTDQNLPDRMSRGQDYWGYYNGADNNWTLMPNGVYTFWTTSRITNLGERRANFTYAHANSLKQINYPTGGFRTFTYEANKALLETNSQILPDASFYNTGLLSTDSFTNLPEQPNYKAYFDVNSTDGGAVWTYYLSGDYTYGTTWTVLLLDSATGNTQATFNSLATGSFPLPNGSFQVQIWLNGGTWSSFNANWPQLALNTARVIRFDKSFYKDPMTVGGIRVQSISDYDPVSGQTLTTNYSYHWYSGTDTTQESGLLVSSPWVANVASCFTNSCDIIRLSAVSSYPLNSVAGSYVMYTDVRTSRPGNGHTDNLYSFDYDGEPGDAPGIIPYAPIIKNWRRGKLIASRIYDNNNILLEKDSTIYPYINDAYTYNEHSIIPKLIYQEVMGYKMVSYPNGGCFAPSYLTSQFCQVESSLRYLYTSVGTQTLRTDYLYYDSLSQPLIKQKTETLNNGQLKYTNYRYAFNGYYDFIIQGMEGIMINPLLQYNYLVPVEVTEQKQTGNVITFAGGTHYLFGTFNGNRYHPYLARTYPTLSNYSELDFRQYDSSGNLTEQSKDLGPHTVWLWGYNYNCPVAKITASSYSACLSLVNNSVLQNPSSDAALRTELNKIRTGLQGIAQVTTYTWSPLEGITSQTDPAGNTTYYEFDMHGRLSLVRDLLRNIIKKYSYNYYTPAL